MKQTCLDSLLKLRFAVGFLGQKKLANWWDCIFLDETGIRFLQTTFPRSARAAGLHSVVEAACSIHDQAMGKIGSFHLFRLPPNVEDQLDQLVSPAAESPMITDLISSREAAIGAIEAMADAKLTAPSGPVQVGEEKRILTQTSVQELAAHYLSAFEQDIKCFPYFAPSKE